MSKEEIALELTKISYPNALRKAETSIKDVKVEKVVTELYNYILNNMDCEGQNK